MNKINIEENIQKTSIKKIKLYKDIFGESPWEEGFICQNCERILPKGFFGKCECGEINDFEPYYKYTDLKDDFIGFSLKENYSELIAKILDNEVGFIWGWDCSIQELNNDKLGLDENQLKEFENQILKKYNDFNIDNFYYFAEIGVKKDFRGKDIAGKLYRKNLDNLKNRGEKYILVRTTKKSDVPYKWFLKEGYEEVFLYNDEQDRVILVYKI